MPFASDFTEIYTGFIRPALVEAGYDVVRADDLQNQQSILRDIVQSLQECDLLVADLTESNPNVYYELGLAHGLRRPVILLTQRLADLPFDLRSYRVIPYDTHFAKISAARQALVETAVGARQGRVLFGNPVSDFTSSSASVEAPRSLPEPLMVTSEPSADDATEMGLFDHFLQFHDVMEQVTAIFVETNDDTGKITADTKAAGELFQAASRSSSSDALREQREIAAQLGEALQGYAERLDGRSSRFAAHLGPLQESLEFIVAFRSGLDAEGLKKKEAFLSTLRASRDGIAGASEAARSLGAMLKEAPRIERRLNRAQMAAVRALRRYAESLETVSAILTRVEEIEADARAAV